MMDFSPVQRSWPMRKEKSPFKGVRDYLYGCLYDFDKMDKSGTWEIGDEIIDGFDPPRRYQLADLVNEIAKRFELVEPKRVRRSKAELKGEAGDWTMHQRDDFLKVLDHLLEQIKEEPVKLYRLPQYGEYAVWREGHDADLMFENAMEENEEIADGLPLSDVTVVPLTQSEEELLADSDIVTAALADRAQHERDVRWCSDGVGVAIRLCDVEKGEVGMTASIPLDLTEVGFYDRPCSRTGSVENQGSFSISIGAGNKKKGGG